MKCNGKLFVNDVEIAVVTDIDSITYDFKSGLTSIPLTQGCFDESGDIEVTVEDGISLYDYFENIYKINSLVNFCNYGKFLDEL